MKSAVETIDPTRVKLTVEVSQEDLKPSLDHAYSHLAEQVNIPGFRRGKVPPRILEQRIGKPAVMEHAINDALPGLYTQAVREADIKPIGQPSIDVTAIPGITEGADELVFTAEVDVRPEFELPKLADLTVTVEDAAVTDEEVEEALTTLRQRFGTLVGVERKVKTGDFVTIDLTAAIGEDEIDSVSGVSYEVGSGNMLEGLDDALVGMSASEDTTFSAPLAGGDRVGEDAEITVTVTAVKEQELPEADDEFAQMASEVDTIAELRENLRGQVGEAKENNRAVAARDNLLEQLVEKTDFPLPSGVIEDEIHRHLEGEGRLEDDEHREEVREEATSALRRQLLLDSLADQVKVQVGQNELIEFLLRSAQQYRQDPSEFIAAADQNGQIPLFVAELARNKSLAVALRQVKVVDGSGAEVDLSAYIGSDEADAAAADAAAEAEGTTVVEDVTQTPEVQEAAAAAEEKPAKKAAAKKAPAKKDAGSDDEAEPAKKAPAKKAPAKKAPAKKAAKDAEEA